MSDQMVYYIELKGKFDDLEKQIDKLFQTVSDNSKKMKDALDSSFKNPPIEKYNQYIEAKKKLDEKSYKDFEEYAKLKTKIEEAQNDKALSDYIDYKKKEEEYSKKANQSLVGDYNNYINAKKKLDNKSQMTFGDYEKAKTTVENAENDKRLKSYIDYRNREKEHSDKILKGWTNIGTAMTIGITAPLILIGRQALKTAASFEQYKVSFETMLGSAEKSNKLLKDIEKFSATTPFQMPGLVEGAKRLIAFGVSSEDVIEKLRNLGNAAGGNEQILDRLTLAYGKLQAKGRASLEELNMFTEAGVPILQALAEQYGVTTAEIYKMVNEGKIGFEDVDKALTALTTGSGKFAGMIEKQGQTLNGVISTMQDNFNLLGKEIIEGALPAIKGLALFMANVADSFRGMDDAQKGLVVGISGFAMAAGPVIVGVSKLIPLLKSLTIEQIKSNIAAYANPYVLVAAALVAATAAITYYIVKSNDVTTITNKLSAATSKLKGYMSEYKDVVSQLTDETKDLNEAEKASLELRKIQLRMKIQDSINEAIKSYRKLTLAKREDMEADKETANNRIALYNNALKDDQKLKELAAIDRWPINNERDKAAYIKVVSDRLGDTIKKYGELDSQLETFKASSEEFVNTLVSARNENLIDDAYIEQLRSIPELYEKVRSKMATSSWGPPGGTDDTIPPPDDTLSTAYKDQFDKIKAEYEKYSENIKKIDSKLLSDTDKAKLEAENATLKASYDKYKIYLKSLEKSDEDSYEKAEKDHSKYLENKKKLDSEFLSAGEKEALEVENRKLESNYKKFEDYLKKLEASESGTPEKLIEYLKIKNQLYDGDYQNIEKYNELEKESEDKKNDYKLDSYIEYLKQKKGKTKEEQKAYEDLIAYEKKINKKNEEDKVKSAKDAYTGLISFVSEYANAITTNFELAANATDINYAKIANSVGGINKAFLGAAVGIDAAMSKYGDFADKIKNTEDPIERSNLKIAQTVSLVADTAKMAFDVTSQVLGAISQVFAQETERQLAIIEQNYKDTVRNIDATLQKETDIIEDQTKKRLEALKAEMAERGVILETGYESELEKAQSAHQEALDELREYQDEDNEARLVQLERYRESLQGKTDAEIEEALKQKENELKRKEEQEQLNLQKVADEKAAEVAKQKILEEAERSKLQLQYQADSAKVTAENEAESQKHAASVDSFYKQRDMQIAQAWISYGSGVAGIWSGAFSSIPNPLAAAIVASALSTVFAGLTGGMTGLIASQSPPAAPIPKALPTPPKFALGGIVEGSSYAGDNLDIKANSGEMILNRDQQVNLFEAIKSGSLGIGGGSSNISVNVYCYMDSSDLPIKKKLIEIQRDEAFRR